MTSPPALGSSNWGTPLDAYMASILLEATTAFNNIATHSSGVDPHGDRAYALGLINPILTGTNQANGYIKAGSNGLIPNALLPSAGGLSDVYDVSSSTFGGIGNGSMDDTTAIQSALTACANAGGGEVWIPNGTWLISSPLVIGNNTWLHLSPGALIQRTINTGTGLLPGVMVANFNGSTALSGITGNIMITGGIWDVTAGNTQTTACTAIQLANASFCSIGQAEFIMPQNNVAIQLFGCNLVVIRDMLFEGYTPTVNPSSITVPAIQISKASSAEMPVGLNGTMYSNAICQQIVLQSSVVGVPFGGYHTGSGQQHGGYGYLVGSLTNPTPSTHQVLSVNNCVANGVTQNFWSILGWTNVVLTGTTVNHGYADSASVPSISTTGVIKDGIGLPTIRTAANFTMLDVEQWTVLSSLSNGFTQSGSGTPPSAYRVDMERRRLDFTGAIILPSSGSYNGITFFTIPYTPANKKRWPSFPFSATGFGGGGAPRVELLTSGALLLEGIAGSINGTFVDISGFAIPLDY